MRLFKLILALMLVASLIPTAMVGWTSVSRTRELLIRDAQELAQERVRQLLLKAENVLEEPAAAVAGLARLPGFFQLSVEEQRAHLSAVLNQRREISVVTIFSADRARIPGLQAFAIKDIPPTEIAEHEARAAALLADLSGVQFSEVYWSKARAEPVVTVALPVGEPAKGYLSAEICLSELTEVLKQEKLGSSGFAYAVDARGHLVAGPGLEPLSVGADLSTRPAVAHLRAALLRSPGLEVFHVGNFGEGEGRVVGAYAALPEVGWAVVSEQPIELAYRQVGTLEREIAMAVGGAIAVALALAALFSRTLSRPLKKFGKAAMDIAQGRFGVQVDFRSKNELGELAQTFNYMSAQIEAYDHETKRLYESLENGYLETIVALANSIDSKDSYTRGHSQRVGDLATEIGRELGLTDHELKLLRYGGILHDVGKIGIVESILCKQTRLTDQEMTIMRDHPVIGDSIVQAVSFLSSVRAAVRNHHERWDGTGYPDGLKGEAIPLMARIVSCADTFDACTSTRPYQMAMTVERAMEILENLKGAALDPQVVDALRRVLEKKGARLAAPQEANKLAS